MAEIGSAPLPGAIVNDGTVAARITNRPNISASAREVDVGMGLEISQNANRLQAAEKEMSSATPVHRQASVPVLSKSHYPTIGTDLSASEWRIRVDSPYRANPFNNPHGLHIAEGALADSPEYRRVFP